MSGVVLAAVPTPFTADGELDVPVARQVLALAASTVGGAFVAGTTGEFPALDDAERLTLFELALAEAGQDNVIAHIGAADAHRAARLAAAAAGLGARRLAAITPYYLPADAAELTAYYLRIREAAPSAQLYAYIFPERTGLTVPVAQFAALASDVGLAGAKLSGSAAADVAACAEALPDLRIYSGDDTDLGHTLACGGAGVISARAAAYGEVFAALAAAGPGSDEAARRQGDVDSIVAAGSSIGLVKAALRERGLRPMAARMTVGEPSPETAETIRLLVRRLAPNRTS